MKDMLRMMAETNRLQREAEYEQIKEQAGRTVGLGALLKGIFS